MRLPLALAALIAFPALAEDPGFSFHLTKGGVHMIAINGLIGAGAGTILFLATATGGPTRDLAVGGAASVGLLALFLGGGLTVGHLVDPTPPMAWSSFFAGCAGAGVGLGVMVTSYPSFPPRPFESILLAMALGYLIGAGIDLALPGRSSLSWKDFWVPMVISIVPGAALIVGGSAAGAFRAPEFTTLAILYPLVSFLVARAVLSAIHPFDPWFDDLEPPFRAEPIIGLNPHGAMVGLAAAW